MSIHIIKIPRTDYIRAFTGNTVILKSEKAKYWGLNLPTQWYHHSHIFLKVTGRMEESMPEPSQPNTNVPALGGVKATHFSKVWVRNTHTNEAVMLDAADLLPTWLRDKYGYRGQEIDCHQLSLAFNQPDTTNIESAITHVETHYHLVRSDQELQLGDHLWLLTSTEVEKANIPLHWYAYQHKQSAIYIAPNLIFIKSDSIPVSPYVLRDLTSVYFEQVMAGQKKLQGNLKFWRKA